MVFIKKGVNKHSQGNSGVLSFASFAFFISLVVLTGLGIGCLISAPLFILGRLWRKFYDIGAFFLQNTIRWLIVAPVFRTDVGLALPEPCLTLSNHRSTLDAFILLSRIPGIRLITKESLFLIPFLSFVMRVMGQIKVKKRGIDPYLKAMEEAGEALKAGSPVHIFPEMGRSPPGFSGTQRFHLAPFKMAIESKAKIVPVVFFNTDQAWPRGFLKMNRGIVVKVKSLEALTAADYTSSEALMKEVQQRINSALLSERVTTA